MDITEKIEQSDKDTLSIVFTGDVLLDRGVRRYIESEGIKGLFADVENDFRKSDATVINLECPITDTISPLNKKFIFHADPIVASKMRSIGITHAALANNHTIDQGRRGLAATYRHLLRHGIVPLGYGHTLEESLVPAIIEKSGIKVALFNAVLLTIENWSSTIEGQPSVCQPTIQELSKAIYKYKQSHQDTYCVAILHWGIEYQTVPSINQRYEAAMLVNSGADAIIGHHPHVIQTTDIINGKPIYYSLGNFIFDNTHPLAQNTLMVRLCFTKDSIVCEETKLHIQCCRPVRKQSNH
ncbi:MAG: CapA family protein [Bacteroides sp.]|nr:CapA family protein [Roseburia sp.]MCM1345533.1 CapA family protein [Bacteroides sp.]MCM1420364.1 CapA family protein [Bacteroides sp.]